MKKWGLGVLIGYALMTWFGYEPFAATEKDNVPAGSRGNLRSRYNGYMGGK